ncbi:hypothetical protein [Methanotorris formicicus]|uniref:Uncharacterized protein n=1 Tax=Methanotorris formicicus Mc-S-70 TaxID=647171 RepID=H1L113_9EURY|nr:hypothetical protein [Methanotorris formicicus]EHP84224.1 hypothetical protein MetfoDRAFT_1737 [Methanotorris formicicus Mc-S-70]
MKVWITTIGSSPYAVFSTLWFAVVKDSFIPNKIYLLWNNKVEKNKETLKNYIETLSKAYNINIQINEDYKVNEEDFKTFANALKEIIIKEKKEGNEIAIDMTPGRKFMSAFSMFAGLEGVSDGKNKYKCDRVYYLHLRDMGYINYPLFLIPLSLQELHEMKSELTNTKISREILNIEGKSSLKVNRKEIMVILNCYFLKGRYKFEVKVENQKIVEFILWGNKNKATIEIFNKNLNFSDFVGNPKDLKSVLNASGICELRFTMDWEKWFNEEEFFGYLWNKLKEKKTYYITFDTNALINQIPQRFIDFIEKQREKISPNFLISQCVIKEITDERGFKIKDTPDSDYLNQPSPKDRLFKLGLSQLKLLREKNAITFNYDGKWDNDIKDSFVEFLGNKKGELLIITSDKNFFHNLSYLDDIIPIYANFRNIKKEVRWENIRDFLYVSSVVFGKIDVKYIGEISSVWRGKNPIEWDNEIISVKGIDNNTKKVIEVLKKIVQ